MKKIILTAGISLAILATSLNADKVLATVNDENITEIEISNILRSQQVDFKTLPKETKERVVNQAIDKKLLMQKALKSGIQKKKQYKDALKKLQEGLALEVWMQAEFKKIKITKATKKEFYKNNQKQFKVEEELEARHILVKTEKEAKDIIKTLDKSKDAKSEFEKLAKTLSVGPSGVKGGYLGKFNATQMVPEFSKAALALKVGTYSKAPVKTQFGFHLIYLENKTPAKISSFSEVDETITKQLIQAEYEKTIKSNLKELRKDAKIVITLGE